MDEDWFSINVAAGVSLTATVTANGVEPCGPPAPPGTIDSEVEILSGMNSLDFNDDISTTNQCSSAAAFISTAGTYYIRVGSSKAWAAIHTFSYCVTVTAQ